MDTKTTENQIKQWLRQQDRTATHVKIWHNPVSGKTKFTACIGQESYGHIFCYEDNVLVG